MYIYIWVCVMYCLYTSFVILDSAWKLHYIFLTVPYHYFLYLI